MEEMRYALSSRMVLRSSFKTKIVTYKSKNLYS